MVLELVGRALALTVSPDSGGLFPEGEREPFGLRGVTVEGGVQRRREQGVEEGGGVEPTPATAESQLMEEWANDITGQSCDITVIFQSRL